MSSSTLIGSTPSGDSFQLRILGGMREFIIQGDALPELSTSDSEKSISSAKGKIATAEEELLRTFDRGLIVEVWTITDKFPEPLMHNCIMLDRVEVEKNREPPHVIKFWGRSPVSPLMDYGWSGHIKGPLHKIVSEIAGTRNIECLLDLDEPNVEVDLWLEAASCYAALRILGTIFDFLLRNTREGKLRVISRAKFIASINRKKPIKIDHSQVLSSKLAVGPHPRDDD